MDLGRSGRQPLIGASSLFNTMTSFLTLTYPRKLSTSFSARRFNSSSNVALLPNVKAHT